VWILELQYSNHDKHMPSLSLKTFILPILLCAIAIGGYVLYRDGQKPEQVRKEGKATSTSQNTLGPALSSGSSGSKPTVSFHKPATTPATSTPPKEAPKNTPPIIPKPVPSPLPSLAKSVSVPVLLYHGIPDTADDSNIKKADFYAEMKGLKDAGWRTVTVTDFYDFLEGRKELPKKSFLLTFDDGRSDSVKPADPILKELGFTAVMFIITNRTDTEAFFLTSEEIKNILASGRWEIESHSDAMHTFLAVDEKGAKAHALTHELWLADKKRVETLAEYKTRVKDDLTKAKTILESRYGVKIAGFAYPYGDYGVSDPNFSQAKEILDPIISSLYPMAFYQQWIGGGSYFNFPEPDKKFHMVKRISVKTTWSPADLLEILNSGEEKTLPYHSAFFKTGYDWFPSWGSVIFSNGKLIVETASTTSAQIFLNGGESFRDYGLTAVLDWNKGEEVMLLARFIDRDNFVSCNFTNKEVLVDENRLGKHTILAKKSLENGVPKSAVSLSIRVNGGSTECFIGGKNIVSATGLTSFLKHGSVGFKIYDSKENNARVTISEITVE